MEISSCVISSVTCPSKVKPPSNSLTNAACFFSFKGGSCLATEVLIAEAGGKYIASPTRNHDNGEMRFNLIFGKPSVVDWIVSTLDIKAKD